jgi:hypothetical protein
MESLENWFDEFAPLIATGLGALAIAQAVRILYIAGVISFKVTNRGVGK